MWLTDIFNRLWPWPPIGPHPDELRREREAKIAKFKIDSEACYRRRKEMEAENGIERYDFSFKLMDIDK